MWRRTYLPVSVRLAMSFLSLQLRLTENIRWLFPIGNVCVTGGHVTSRNQDLSWSSSSWCHIHPLCLEAERQWRQGKKANQLPHYWMVICDLLLTFPVEVNFGLSSNDQGRQENRDPENEVMVTTSNHQCNHQWDYIKKWQWCCYCGITLRNKVQKLQNRAAHGLTYSNYDVDAGPLFKLLGWKNLTSQQQI